MKAICGECQKFRKGCLFNGGVLVCSECYAKDVGSWPTPEQLQGKTPSRLPSAGKSMN